MIPGVIERVPIADRLIARWEVSQLNIVPYAISVMVFLPMLIVTIGIAKAIGAKPQFVELPDAVSAMIARAGFLPGAPITWDQWLMLQRDNIVAPGAEGLAALGVMPTPLETVAPGWLVRFRRHGRFTPVQA